VNATDDRERAAARVGAALRDLGYTEDAVQEMLGDEAYAAGPDEVPALVRRLQPGRLGTAVDLLFLGRPVPESEAQRAFGRRGLDALVATQIAVPAGGIAPLARVLPLDDLLVAGDVHSRGIDDPADYVTPFSPTSRICAALTPRRNVESALDVGTGSGAQALFAARHARRVVATDVNGRALAFTRLNAALNGISNIECRAGSLFEPVAGERFDLITCNAPYVISPERRWAYRDAGYRGDEVSELVVRGATAHLAENGYATLNVSWLAVDEDEPDERVLDWIDTRECDGWVLVAWEADPLDHAADWASDLAGDPDEVGGLLDRWTDYFDELGARWVSEGTVVLHRRAGKRRTVRIDSIDPDDVDEAADQVERALTSRARLSELTKLDELLDARLAVATELRLEVELDRSRRRRGAVVALEEGTLSAVDTTPAALELVGELDGRRTLGAVVDEVARRLDLRGAEAARLRRDAVRLSRDLLELGALTLE
jgi:methylase of polypeptide subunit release factors